MGFQQLLSTETPPLLRDATLEAVQSWALSIKQHSLQMANQFSVRPFIDETIAALLKIKWNKARTLTPGAELPDWGTAINADAHSFVASLTALFPSMFQREFSMIPKDIYLECPQPSVKTNPFFTYVRQLRELAVLNNTSWGAQLKALPKGLKNNWTTLQNISDNVVSRVLQKTPEANLQQEEFFEAVAEIGEQSTLLHKQLEECQSYKFGKPRTTAVVAAIKSQGPIQKKFSNSTIRNKARRDKQKQKKKELKKKDGAGNAANKDATPATTEN
jgi:hypothetical protein